MTERAQTMTIVFMLLTFVSPEFRGRATTAAADDKTEASSDSLQLFEDRIMPIFRSPKPSSCVQCHLASVDIKDYILPSHTATFAALREQGLVDVQSPEKSKILTLIKMGHKDADEKARRIHEKTRQAEFDAFSAWIKACCSDSELTNTSVADAGKVGPKKPAEVVRHARKSRVVESFARNIWSQRMRCFPCHTPNELDANNPKHTIPIKKQAELVSKFGLKMNIFWETPEATLNQLIASSRRKIPGRYPLIDVEEPANSLLLLKPTSKLPAKGDDGEFEKPSAKDPVSHMGGLKMHVNDQSYKSFLTWLNDYSRVVGDKYVAVEDLPADNWVPTQRVLRLKDIPDSWGNLTVVQMFVHAKDDSGKWSEEPVAFSQSLVTPRRMAMGPLSVFRKSESVTVDEGSSEKNVSSERADWRPLRPGDYLVKVCLDSQNRIDTDPSLLLGEKDFVGEAELHARWRIGFKQAETLSAKDLTK